MRGLRFLGFGAVAQVLTGACLLLMALSDVVWATVDGTQGATSPAEMKVRAAIAALMGAADGNER